MGAAALITWAGACAADADGPRPGEQGPDLGMDRRVESAYGPLPSVSIFVSKVQARTLLTHGEDRVVQEIGGCHRLRSSRSPRTGCSALPRRGPAAPPPPARSRGNLTAGPPVCGISTTVHRHRDCRAVRLHRRYEGERPALPRERTVSCRPDSWRTPRLPPGRRHDTGRLAEARAGSRGSGLRTRHRRTRTTVMRRTRICARWTESGLSSCLPRSSRDGHRPGHCGPWPAARPPAQRPTGSGVVERSGGAAA